MSRRPLQMFVRAARVLHWLLAVMILAMLFIGAGMVSTISTTHATLVDIHRPLGISILVLVVLRIVVRLRNAPPPLPADLPALQRFAATASHWLLYGLMLAMPLIGWAMVSAAGDPVVMAGAFHLPAIATADAGVFAGLRLAHRYLAYLLFATVLLHIAAALYHALIRRDDVYPSMAGAWARSAPDADSTDNPAVGLAPIATGPAPNAASVAADDLLGAPAPGQPPDTGPPGHPG